MKVHTFEHGRYLLVLERGEDVLRSITSFAEKEDVGAASLQGIGAADFVRLGQYDFTVKDYRVVELRGTLEVVSLIGNISLKDGRPFTHAHLIVTNREGQAFGGHLLEGSTCSLTLEIEIKVLGAGLPRRVDPRFNLHVLY